MRRLALISLLNLRQRGLGPLSPERSHQNLAACPFSACNCLLVLGVLCTNFLFAGSLAYDDFGSIPPVSCISLLNLEKFRPELSLQPDRAKAHYILEGIKHGFLSGFDSSLVVLRTSSRNKRSANEHPEVIDVYLANEVSKGRVLVYHALAV